MNNSTKNTVMQQMIATGNNPNPRHDAMMPAMRAAKPAIGLRVTSVMAGSVITASVTYGI